MANFAKAQGQDLMKQVEEQKRRRFADQEAAQPPSRDNIAKSEMEEMRRILKEKKYRDSEEYSRYIPTESERDSSPERVLRRRKHHHPHHHHHRHHQDSIEADREHTDNESHTDHGHTLSSHRDSANYSEINGELKSIAHEDPSKVLDWLRGYDGAETEKRIVLSEDRIMILLQALREGILGGSPLHEGSFNSLQQDNWVPMERLREAERRSSVAEEQIRYFEQLFNMGEGSDSGRDQDEQLRTVLMKSKTMERHFAHMKKFAEDRHLDVRRMYSNISEKDAKTWRLNSASRGGMVSPEKVKKDLQEHEGHKKRLVQVFSNYNELLRLVKVEHAKRLEAENKSFQLTSQLKRQTATLKRAEKVIKHTALSPIMFNDSHSRAPPYANFDQGSSSMQEASPSPYNYNSGRQSPSIVSSPSTPLAGTFENRSNLIPGSAVGVQLHQKSIGKNSTLGGPSSFSPTPIHQTISKQLTYDLAIDQPSSREFSGPTSARSRVSTSDLIAENHRKEFQELENALIEEGKARGFADVDLYSEKKTVGREETCWEYRHVHFDFTKPNEEGIRPASPSSAEALDLHSFSNLPVSRRTASPGRSEGSSFNNDTSPRDLHDPSASLQLVQHPAADDDHHLLSSAKSIASYRDELQRLNQEEQIVKDHHSLLQTPSLSSPLKLDKAEVFSTPEMRISEERHTIETARANVAAIDDLAAARVSKEPDLAEAHVARGPRNARTARKAKGDIAGHEAMQGAGSNGHVSVEHLQLESTSDLQRRVAGIEAGHMAQLLHRQVKRRRWLLVIQVVLFTVALMWGVFPSCWLSVPPPT